MTIRQILLELRRRHGSFEVIAELFGVNRDYLYRLFSGDRKNPTPEFLAKLGVAVSYQFNEELPQSVRGRVGQAVAHEAHDQRAG